MHLKKTLFSLLFNSSLLLMLVIGIQNSNKQTRVNLLINESVKLPISFVIGILELELVHQYEKYFPRSLMLGALP